MPRGLTGWDFAYGGLRAALEPVSWFRPRLRASLNVRAQNPPPELQVGRRAWIHGASVGEILSAGPVLEALKTVEPGFGAVLSVNTPTGLEAARRSFPGVPSFAMPLDFSGPVARAFDRLKPSLVVLIELEIWPQLLAEAGRRGIPVLCANARVTERSFGRYRKSGALFGPSFRRVARYLAQEEGTAARLRALGVPADRIELIPSLKSAQTAPPRPGWIPPGPPVLVGGSTHPGEEEALVAAWRELPGWRLILAPRHPQRFAEVAALLKTLQVPFSRRSEGPAPGWKVCLLDVIGELRAAYAAADLAFVGGTLAPVGGHNVLEPAVCGVGVLVGPYTHHITADAARLETAGGLLKAADAGALKAAVARLAGDEADRKRLGEAAKATCGDGGREALARTLRTLVIP